MGDFMPMMLFHLTYDSKKMKIIIFFCYPLLSIDVVPGLLTAGMGASTHPRHILIYSYMTVKTHSLRVIK